MLEIPDRRERRRVAVVRREETMVEWLDVSAWLGCQISTDTGSGRD